MWCPPCRLWSSTSTRYPEALVRQLAGAFLRLEATPRARGRGDGSSVIDDNASPAPDCRVKVPPCRLWSSTSTLAHAISVRQKRPGLPSARASRWPDVLRVFALTAGVTWATVSMGRSKPSKR